MNDQNNNIGSGNAGSNKPEPAAEPKYAPPVTPQQPVSQQQPASPQQPAPTQPAAAPQQPPVQQQPAVPQAPAASQAPASPQAPAAPQPPAAAPQPPAAPPAPQYAPPAPPAYSAGAQQVPQTTASDKTNVLAILSLVFAFVFSIAGIVLGHMALNQIKKTGESGRGLALTGLILSYVFTLIALLIFVIYFIAMAALIGSGF